MKFQYFYYHEKHLTFNFKRLYRIKINMNLQTSKNGKRCQLNYTLNKLTRNSTKLLSAIFQYSTLKLFSFSQKNKNFQFTFLKGNFSYWKAKSISRKTWKTRLNKYQFLEETMGLGVKLIEECLNLEQFIRSRFYKSVWIILENCFTGGFMVINCRDFILKKNSSRALQNYLIKNLPSIPRQI